MGDAPELGEAYLRREFEAEPRSFLLKLRCDLEWDREAFSRLATAMERYAAAHADAEMLPKWVVSGFWYTESFVRDWSSHQAFPRPHGEEYYRRAYERLTELSMWLFDGIHPRQDGGPLDPV